VVMLDLECDALIIEMFQHFFKAIRYGGISSLERLPSVVFWWLPFIFVEVWLLPFAMGSENYTEDYIVRKDSNVQLYFSLFVDCLVSHMHDRCGLGRDLWVT